MTALVMQTGGRWVPCGGDAVLDGLALGFLVLPTGRPRRGSEGGIRRAGPGGGASPVDGGGACGTPGFRDGDREGDGGPAEVHPEATGTCEIPFDDEGDDQENGRDATACTPLWVHLDPGGDGAGGLPCCSAAPDGRVAAGGACGDGGPRLDPGAEGIPDDGLDGGVVGTGINVGASLAQLTETTGDGVAEVRVGVSGGDGTRGDEVVGARLVGGPITAEVRLKEQAVTGAGLVARYDGAGRAAARAGDVGGDGPGVRLIGAPEGRRPGTAAGAGRLVPGGPMGFVRMPDADWIVEAGFSGSSRGRARAAVSERDGDGNVEPGIGTRTDGSHAASNGSVRVFRSPRRASFSRSGADAMMVGRRRSDCAGPSIAAGGIRGGDGRAQMSIGVPECSSGPTPRGRITSVRGPVGTGPLDEVGLRLPARTGRGPGPVAASGGDGDGDGNLHNIDILDVIVSACESGGSGRVCLHLGTSF